MTQLITELTNTERLTPSNFIQSLFDSQVSRAVKQALQNAVEICTQWAPAYSSRFYSTSVSKSPLLTQHDGHCWECMSFSENEGGGKIYKFRLREEYWARKDLPPQAIHNCHQAKKQKDEELFPAIELTGFETSYQPQFIQTKFDFFSQMKKLGYDLIENEEGRYLFLPDKEALEVRFEQLRKSDPNLRPFIIQDSEGTASDKDFIQAYFNYDVVLSSGREFVHDHIFHLSSALERVLTDSEQYYQEKERLGNIIQKIDQIISFAQSAIKHGSTIASPAEIEQIQARMAAFIDDIWAQTQVEYFKAVTWDKYTDSGKFQDYRNTVLSSESLFEELWNKRFKDKFLSPETLLACWAKIYHFATANELLVPFS